VISSNGRRASDKARRKTLLHRLAVLAVVLAGLAVVAMLYWRPSDDVPSAYDGAPSWSPDGRTIVFSAERNGQTDIFAMASDGTARRVLSGHPAEEGAPAVSPDGRTIAFETNRDGNFEIYVMDAGGGNARRLTNHPGADRSPAWAPDGTRVAFLSDRDRRPDFDVYLMNADGTAVERLTTTGKNWSPQFSPDGRRLALQTDGDVRALNLEDRAVRRLTFEPENGMSPTWSPDGTRLAFATTRNRRLEIFTMTADGTGQDVLVSMPGASVMDPRWSPDGSRVAFVHVPSVDVPDRTMPQPYAIYVMELDTRRVRRLSP
jgi:Tol biopolymer transport system component